MTEFKDLKHRPWLDVTATPFIDLQGVTKKFGSFTAVDRVDLKIYKEELFSLLGGSGCGKTTLLRMLAGFEQPTEGRILIDGTDMTGIPAYRRPVNMMFQSYALFPHMSVEKNVAYGLKRDGLPRGEIRDRVAEMLRMVELQDFGRRKPHQLSGGQRQRVALARSLVKQPKVLLLDEPLGALDKRLREQTQFELMNIQDRLGVTFIVVTHDQEEAMTLSTRISVMDRGRIIQTGTPMDIYEYPENRFTAEFIGSINQFEARIEETGNGRTLLKVEGVDLPFEADREVAASDRRVFAAVRPEKIWISRQGEARDSNQLRGEIHDIAYMGNHTIYLVALENGQQVKVTSQNQLRSSEHERNLDWDDKVVLHWDASSLLVLPQ